VVVNGSAFERLPFGLATVTCAVPAPAMSAAGIAAVSWLALTNVVVRLVPFHLTVAPLAKFEPVTVNVNAGPPACAGLGERELSVGPAAAGVNTMVGSKPVASQLLFPSGPRLIEKFTLSP